MTDIISTEIRVDLHVHSSASSRPYSWFLRAADSAECDTRPREVFELATTRGMNLVTLTDHDTIQGALALRELGPNTFMSEEVSARFPEDGCIMHTIALDISEAEHAELQRLRPNIYELCAYMAAQGIPYFLCHPLSEVNRRLTQGHLERCFLMFRHLELINGTRDRAHEEGLRRITAGITPETIARWAEQYPRTPVLNPEGRYGFVGGSDDHGKLAIARAFTSFTGQPTAASLRTAFAAGHMVARGQHARAETLPHNIFGVIGGYLAASRVREIPAEPAAPAAVAAVPVPVPAAVPMPVPMPAPARPNGFLSAVTASLDSPALAAAGHRDDFQQRMFHVVNEMLLGANRRASAGIADALARMDLEGLIDRIPGALKATLMGLPYVLGSRYHARDRRSADRFSARLGFPARRGEPRVLVLTDTIDDVNGVALGLRRLARTARGAGLSFTLAAIGDCTQVTIDGGGVVRLPAVHRMRIPEYTEMEIGIPHLPALLHYMVESDPDLVQCSTPGPVGLAGLLAARLTGTPVIGQYHTDVPEYATILTGDPVAGSLVERVVAWFYRQLDRVLVPSRAIADKLERLEVASERIVRVPRGVDTELFHPRQRRADAFATLAPGGPVILYVGRLSREKGLDLLLDALPAWAALGARLVLVGDGPYRPRLEQAAAQLGGALVLAGVRTGDALAELYASCDVFVYPSETETFGNSVVEAQAAGVPVVVASRGAAPESMIPGLTGLVADMRQPGALQAAVRDLLTDPAWRRKLGAAAHEHAQRFAMSVALDGTFELYRRVLGELGEVNDAGLSCA